MKKIILLFLVCVGGVLKTQAQGCSFIYFDYDAAGNRISRTISINTACRTADSSTPTVPDKKGDVKNTNMLQSGDEMFTIYPNPATDIAIIKSNTGVTTISELRIIDMQGKLVHASTPKSTETQVNIADLVPGTYMIEAVTDIGKKTIWKLVKQ